MRERLEERQATFYFIVLGFAFIYGYFFQTSSSLLEQWIPFVLAILLYSMFSQIPFFTKYDFRVNLRFFFALFAVNFIVVPLVVYGLVTFLPTEPALRLAVYLVLLAPCVDYVIVFTALGQGDAKQMLFATPFLLILQLIILPFELWFFVGSEALALMQWKPFLTSFLWIFVLPLFVAVTIQYCLRFDSPIRKIQQASAWLPVPTMALTIFVIVAPQVQRMANMKEEIFAVIPIYIAFIVIMPVLSVMIARLYRLKKPAERALIFSGFTRNSLAVLPLTFALPPAMQSLAMTIILTQTVCELVFELIYIRLVPKWT
ncbi:arsenic resistance protein [Kurthia sp. ISK08]|uniref:arsenic resistance protein n=1 Tax=Kurthia sp. ISK08 TaxID=3385835 RepID=UPI0038FC91A8